MGRNESLAVDDAVDLARHATTEAVDNVGEKVKDITADNVPPNA
jgi:hypothetical protein